jgi:hypothetical protein
MELDWTARAREVIMQRLTVPRKVTIEGATYNLCGDFGPLVEAEAYCGFNLADVLFTWGQDSESILNGARKLLPCALHHFHPEVSYEDVQGMLDRAVAADDPAILHALWHMWPAKTAQTQAANLNLLCDLEALAEANEFLEGKPNLLSICIGEVGFNLDHIWRLWPCAVHHFRPELSLDEARQLLTLEGVRLVIGLLGIVEPDSFAGGKG